MQISKLHFETLGYHINLIKMVSHEGAFTPTQENAWSACADPAQGSAVDWFVEIVWCCLRSPRVHWASAAGARIGRSQSNSSVGPAGMERWLVSIYRSKTQCRDMGLLQLKLRAYRRQRKHLTRVENTHCASGGTRSAWVLMRPSSILSKRVDRSSISTAECRFRNQRILRHTH